MVDSEDSTNWRIENLARIIFALSWFGSYILTMLFRNHYIKEGNPVMRLILDGNPLGSLVLTIFVMGGVLLGEVNYKFVRIILYGGAVVLFLNFLRELSIVFFPLF